jgi:hypothetical protein
MIVGQRNFVHDGNLWKAASAAVTATNEAAIRAISEFRRAFAEHGQEVRQALATTTTTELVVSSDIKNMHEAVMVEFEKPSTKLSKKPRCSFRSANVPSSISQLSAELSHSPFLFTMDSGPSGDVPCV